MYIMFIGIIHLLDEFIQLLSEEWLNLGKIILRFSYHKNDTYLQLNFVIMLAIVLC